MEQSRLDEILHAARLGLPAGSDVGVDGHDPVLASRYAVGEAAAVALAACGAGAAALWELRAGDAQSARTDVRSAAASLLSFAYQRVAGAPTERASASNPAVALYQCADGRWVHLHGAFPKLRQATLDVLGCGHDGDEIARAVRTWRGQELEDALASAGTCGAMVRSAEEWAAHAQGRALASLPAVEVLKVGESAPTGLPAMAGDARQPLSGVHVLDLTRVLAGPSSARTLAWHGAEVLHIASPNLPTSPAFDIDTGHGKRSAYLDLDVPDDAARLRELVAGCDVFVEGFRSGALERRGFGIDHVTAMRPSIVYVSINCYGHTGPWRTRPGWEQLAQSVTGIAAAQGAPGAPKLVPAAACDYTTGYLAAYGTMLALARRVREGGSWRVRASLCQTAMWIERLGASCDPDAASGIGSPGDLLMESETPFGLITHLRPPVTLSETPARYARPTVPLGTDAPVWEG
jgi:crotonobetainyl-CoA:carnitine CoA-transferase CaiB-like acyl-CoA transferase